MDNKEVSSSNGTTALITGATSGIGFELAKIHAAGGGNLVLVARTKSKLKELKSTWETEYHIKVFIIEKDLSVNGAALEVYDEVRAQNIDIDYLINNAGFGDYGFFHETDWMKEQKMIHLNITALTQLTKLCLQEMTRRKRGRIMNLASTAAFQPGPLMAVYFATKAYVLHFTEAIANEVEHLGVTVTALCPGPTETRFQTTAGAEDNQAFNKHKLPTATEVAAYGYKAMMQGKRVAVHGWKNKILSNSVRFVPRELSVKIVRKVQDKAHGGQ